MAKYKYTVYAVYIDGKKRAVYKGFGGGNAKAVLALRKSIYFRTLYFNVEVS